MKIISTLLLLLVTSLTVFSQQNSEIYGRNNQLGKFAMLNKIKMYYEIYGEGNPLILIHGNGESISIMREQIKFFSKYYKVIAADSRGHGKTEMGEGILTYKQMADDWSALLDHLKIDSAYVVGWSDGGIIGLLMAIHHPSKVKKLAVMGANLQPDTSAVYPWAVSFVKKKQKLIDAMIAKNDTTQNWSRMKQYFGLLGNQPNIPLSDLHKISAPVLVLAGDKDVIREEHTVLIYQNIPKAHLCIFPGQTHMVPVTDPKLFNKTVYKFLSSQYSRPDTKDFFK